MDASMPLVNENLLGNYLKDRRAKLDPAMFGFEPGRRRTPGLRREEVAQRAHVSATWYTWLEQGRGGAPSAEVLDRLARALLLSEVEREHLFMLAQGRPPEVQYQEPEDGVSPRLQRVLDSFELSAAYIKTSTWDILAWNRAATVVLTDYGKLPPGRRNLLRLIFSEPRVRQSQTDWEGVARFVVGAFRGDVARAGATKSVEALVADLCRMSPDFEALWRDHDVRTTYGQFAKQLAHPRAGVLTLEYSAFAVDGRPELSMVIYNPTTEVDREKVRGLLADAALASPPSSP